jgi:transposase-like protein
VARYSPERKESVLKKLLPRHSVTVSEVASREGISVGSLYNWRSQARAEGKPVPGPNKTSDEWSGEAKLAVVVETSVMGEAELSQYCRKKGFYPEQVKMWKQDCLEGFNSNLECQRETAKQSRADKKQIRQLEKELSRKEKALAEAAARLVLRKKLKTFYGEDQEDD